jgi:hypothetical protein
MRCWTRLLIVKMVKKVRHEPWDVHAQCGFVINEWRISVCVNLNGFVVKCDM